MKDNDVEAILPLYLYDHSGLTMNTTGFSCGWDSGQVGYIFITKESFKNFQGTTAEEVLIGQVKTYDLYLRGEVFWFKVVEEKHCECCGSNSEEHIDSCSGFYGDDFEKNGLGEYVNLDEYEED